MLRYALLIIAGFLIGTFLGRVAKADTTRDYTFHYRGDEQLKITTYAENRCAAYKKAAKLCYSILTNGVYPGEERGLDIIDICANPTNYNP